MRCFVRLVGAVGLLFAVGAGSVEAQSPPGSYFHEAAQQYVEGNDAAAKRVVREGLRKAPSDPRLVALRKKLEQNDRPKNQQDDSSSSKQSQRHSNQSSNTASQEEGEASQSNDQGPSQSGQDEQSGTSSMSGQQSAENDAPEREAGKSDPSGDASSPTGSTTEQNDRRGEGSPTDTLSREQAERLLQALEGQERRLLRELQTRSATQTSVEKDW